MSFGFQCFELDGVTVQNIGASGTPAFVRELPPDLAPLGGSRAFFQGVQQGVAPYASTTTLRAALVAGLTGPEFVGVNFFENASAPAPVVTLNAVGEIASLMPVPALLLAPGVGDAVRVTYTGGTYVDVQGTVATVAAALSASAPSTGGTVGPLACVYLEQPAPNGRGDDATGQRGNAAKPFSTLQAALAAMFDGDELRIASGSFKASPALVPPTLVSATITGILGATTIDAVGLPGCLDLSAAKRTLWVIQNVGLQSPDPGTFALKADGVAVAQGNYFADGALALSNVSIRGDFFARYVGNLFFQDCSAPQPFDMSFITCGAVTHFESYFPSGTQMFHTVNATDPLSPTFPAEPGPLFFDGACSFFSPGLLTLKGQPRLVAAPGSILPTVMGSNLANAGSGPGFGLTVNGRVTRLDFAVAGSEIPDGFRTLDIRGATIIEAAQFALAPGSLLRCTVEAGGAQFLDGSSVILAGLGVDVRCEGCSFFAILTNVVTVADGTVRPSPFALAPVAVAGLAVPFVLPFRLPGNAYAVNLDADDATTLPLAVTTRTDTGFTAAVTVAAGNLRALVSYYGN